MASKTKCPELVRQQKREANARHRARKKVCRRLLHALLRQMRPLQPACRALRHANMMRSHGPGMLLLRAFARLLCTSES